MIERLISLLAVCSADLLYRALLHRSISDWGVFPISACKQEENCSKEGVRSQIKKMDLPAFMLKAEVITKWLED